ncbi:MAG: YhbY family RNA-binding protein [Candidatus Njordarchaeum guaymaensis]
MKKPIDKIRALMQQGSADVIIGKSGISINIITRIEQLIKKKKFIKAKFQRNLAPKKEDVIALAIELANKLDIAVGEIRGRTVVFYVKSDSRKKN